MSGAEKAEALDKVASSGLPKRRVLGELGVPRSAYYRWLRRKEQQGLEDDVGASTPPWNKLTSQEIASVMTAAREMPELSCRQLAAWTTDNMGFSVSESTVYRILRREGLVKRPEMQLAAGKEYHRKTTGPHQMWATDASYFRVVGWGYYYMVTVMDDYSRFILAHRLQRDMTSDSFIEVVLGGGGQDRHGPDPDRRPDQAAERQRPRLCFKSLQGLPGRGGHQAHPGNALPSSDQREAGALPPDPEARRKSTAVRDAFRPGGGHRGLRQLLQLPALSQGPGERDAVRRPQGTAAGDSTKKEGGASPNNPTAKTAQQDTQGAD